MFMQPAIHRVVVIAAGPMVASLGLVPVKAAGQINWPQWAQSAQQQGFVEVAGQSLNRILVDTVYDPNVPAEQAASGGDLLAHYQAPLLHQNNVFMEFKSGPFTDRNHWNSQTWHEKRLQWEGGTLVEKWDFATDWKPEPNGPGGGRSMGERFGLAVWEPVFHGAVVGGFAYVPGAGGTIFKLDKGDGTVVTQTNPFGSAIDPNTFVAGPISADEAGNVYFNAIKLDATDPWGALSATDVVDSWLVKVGAGDSTAKVSYKSLVSGRPTTCTTNYNYTTDAPWPPPNPAPTGPCGSRRRALNVAPAVSPARPTSYPATRAALAS